MFQKVMSFLGLSDDELQRQEEEIAPEEQQQTPDGVVPLKRQGTVVSLHTQKQVRVYLAEPESYEDAQGIADHLRNRRPVVINLHRMSLDDARRIIDFISGCTYALGGAMQKLGHNIFLCAPENVDIQGQITDALAAEGMSGSQNHYQSR
jgi:cell division inhibitor SepF